MHKFGSKNSICGKNLIFNLIILFAIIAIASFPVSANTSEYMVQGGKIYYNTETGMIFSCDESVTSVVIPREINGIEIRGIAEKAFQNCVDLERIIIPDTVIEIGDAAFNHCESLKNVKLSNNLSTIGKYVFYDCHKLTEINLPENLISISDYAFCNAGLETLIIPEGVREIGKAAFQYTDMEGIYLPITLDKIGEDVFEVCDNLTDVFYAGFEEDWDYIQIDDKISANQNLLESKFHFNSDIDEYNAFLESRVHIGMNVDIDFDVEEEMLSKIVLEDVSDDEYYSKEVKWVVSKGIAEGMGDNKFFPDEECTRAQIITFIWRAYGSPKVKIVDNPYLDLDDTSVYYYDAVMWALKNKIITDMNMEMEILEDKFEPDLPCTRAQAVTFLYRISGCPPIVERSGFADVAENNYFYDAVSWAISEGITFGVADSFFGSENTCTRAQIACFLYRTLVK